MQMFYPTDYNGAFVACPDPVDFHAYMTADLYKQANMFYLQGAHKQVEQPAMRNYLGQTLISMRDNIAYEAALGDHGRSGEQFDIWQAVYGPVGPDGYPAQIFDKQTGSHRSPGRRLLARSLRPGCDPADATGTSWVRCCRASSTSTSAPPTLTF